MNHYYDDLYSSKVYRKHDEYRSDCPIPHPIERSCCCCCCKPGPQGPTGPTGPQGPTGQFLSSYMEALGNNQTIANDADIIFDLNSIDSVGDNIDLNSNGKTFTVTQTGLYHIEWNINLESVIDYAIVGIIENGAGASGSATSVPGNFSSGTLINIDSVPFTISLHNYGAEISISNPIDWEDSAASIRIARFADGPA